MAGRSKQSGRTSVQAQKIMNVDATRDQANVIKRFMMNAYKEQNKHQKQEPKTQKKLHGNNIKHKTIDAMHKLSALANSHI